MKERKREVKEVCTCDLSLDSYFFHLIYEWISIAHLENLGQTLVVYGNAQPWLEFEQSCAHRRIKTASPFSISQQRMKICNHTAWSTIAVSVGIDKFCLKVYIKECKRLRIY